MTPTLIILHLSAIGLAVCAIVATWGISSRLCRAVECASVLWLLVLIVEPLSHHEPQLPAQQIAKPQPQMTPAERIVFDRIATNFLEAKERERRYAADTGASQDGP
jgi:hypothetical protein